MAIYSLNLGSIGRSTHQAGTAGAHIRYIARPGEDPTIIAENMPSDGNAARAWMDAQESADPRKNARHIDKIRVALPRELSPDQRVEVVREFMHDLTQGNKTPWFAAFHETGQDVNNPHAHIVLRDRSIVDGKRVVGMSDSKKQWQAKGKPGESPTHHVRERWEHYANAALQRAGHDAQIDRRSLEDQGIDRIPQIHEGPRAQKIESFVKKPASKIKVTNDGRIIDYPKIDRGKTRSQHNADIIDFNLEKAARSPDFETRVMARFHKDQHQKDRTLMAWISKRAKSRTQEERELKKLFSTRTTQTRDISAKEIKAVRKTLDDVRGEREALLVKHQKQRRALSAEQKSARSKLAAFLATQPKTKLEPTTQSPSSARGFFNRAVTGAKSLAKAFSPKLRIRAHYKAQRADLKAAQRFELEKFAEMRKMLRRQSYGVQKRNKRHVADIKDERLQALNDLASRHAHQLRDEDLRLQARETERETGRAVVVQEVRAVKSDIRLRDKELKQASGDFSTVANPPAPVISVQGSFNDQNVPDEKDAPALDFEEEKRVRSPNRKARVKGEKAARMRKAKDAKLALQKQRGDKIAREEFNNSKSEDPIKRKLTREERIRKRDELDREIKKRNKLRRDRIRDRGFDIE